jgi:hypothetical protein
MTLSPVSETAIVGSVTSVLAPQSRQQTMTRSARNGVQRRFLTKPTPLRVSLETMIHVLSLETMIHVLSLETMIHVLSLETMIHVLSHEAMIHVLSLETMIHVLSLEAMIHVMGLEAMIHVLSLEILIHVYHTLITTSPRCQLGHPRVYPGQATTPVGAVHMMRTPSKVTGMGMMQEMAAVSSHQPGGVMISPPTPLATVDRPSQPWRWGQPLCGSQRFISKLTSKQLMLQAMTWCARR